MIRLLPPSCWCGLYCLALVLALHANLAFGQGTASPNLAQTIPLHYVGSNRFQPTASVITVRAPNGRAAMVEGPFAETRSNSVATI